MTKSGIGTQQQPVINNLSNGNTTPLNSNTLSNQNNTTTSSSAVISKTEIPIWVSDRKKWVTGINKRTTINDLIFAVLKQCQVLNTNITTTKSQSKSNLDSATTNQNSNTNNNSNIMEQIASQYVLCEHESVSHDNYKILDGDSKVYKYFNRWIINNPNGSTSSTTSSNQPQSTMLKIYQKQQALSNDPESPDVSSNNNTNTTSSSNILADNSNHQHHSSSSLASKLLKKIGVINNNSPAQHTTNSNNNNVQSSTSSNQMSNVNGQKSAFRLVEVKLPATTTTTTTAQSSQKPHSPSTNTTNSNSVINFDPNSQKILLFNSIVERESKLKQQKERFALLDEILKETERKSNQNSMQSKSCAAQLLKLKSSNPNNSSSSLSSNIIMNQLIDVKDILTHFPEIQHVHNLNEIEQFSLVCSQFFQLEESIQAQKELLANLETELQKELNQNNTQLLSGGNIGSPTTNNGDTAETIELRKEVSLSREQTRIQCKQLHDLDAKMRLSEQNLLLKEQQLQQLLEDLYVQEIYADNVIDSMENSNQYAHNFINHNHERSMSSLRKVNIFF
jgi:hypothetical protein